MNHNSGNSINVLKDRKKKGNKSVDEGFLFMMLFNGLIRMFLTIFAVPSPLNPQLAAKQGVAAG